MHVALELPSAGSELDSRWAHLSASPAGHSNRSGLNSAPGLPAHLGALCIDPARPTVSRHTEANTLASLPGRHRQQGRPTSQPAAGRRWPDATIGKLVACQSDPTGPGRLNRPCAARWHSSHLVGDEVRPAAASSCHHKDEMIDLSGSSCWGREEQQMGAATGAPLKRIAPGRCFSGPSGERLI